MNDEAQLPTPTIATLTSSRCLSAPFADPFFGLIEILLLRDSRPAGAGGEDQIEVPCSGPSVTCVAATLRSMRACRTCHIRCATVTMVRTAKTYTEASSSS